MRHGFNPWVGKIPWRRAWQPTPVFLPRESHESRSLVGYSPHGCKGLDRTEATWHAHTQETHRLRERTYSCQGEGWGKGQLGSLDMYILLYLKWITNKNLLYSTWNSAQCYVAAWMGGEFEGDWIHVYVWMSLSAVHLKLLQHC